MKIAVNKCYGGFSLSNKAIKRLLELKGKECYFYKQTKYSFKHGKDEYKLIDNPKDEMFVDVSTVNLGIKTDNIPNDYYFYYGNIERTDADLIQVIEELGDDASGRFGDIKIVEIPDNVKWEIDNYDGIETIHEVHRSW